MTGVDTRLKALEPYASHFGRSVADTGPDLFHLGAMLEKWQRVQNLVSRETVAALWERHILDSLQLLPLLRLDGPEQNYTLVDIGSGGGFPALPLAIALKNRPIHLHLIESRIRKCGFLKAVIRELGLNATVHTARIEEVNPKEVGPVHAITARALAPLPLLYSYIEPFWQDGGTRAFLHKGREYGEELRQADSVWQSDVIKHPSSVDPQGVILEVTALGRID